MRRGEYQSVICPYGYRKSADGRMEPDEDVAPNVQMIFQWASEGNTAAEITRKLYAMNIPTPGEYRKLKGKAYYNVSRTNGVWSTSTVLRILVRSKIYRYLCNWQEKGKRDWQPTYTVKG